MEVLRPAVHWVREIPDLRFAVMPRPRGGEWLAGEVLGWRESGIRTVVSLLEWDEAIELGLRDEEALCNSAGLHFISYPIPDRGVPGVRAGFAELISTLVERLRAGDSVAVHCRTSIDQSGLVDACVLAQLNAAPDSTFTMLSRARKMTVPDTNEQTE